MSRYYFNVIDGKFLVDEDGTECSDMDEVREQAITTAGAILRDLGRKFAGSNWQMRVTDGDKRTVLRLDFSIEEPAAEECH